MEDDFSRIDFNGAVHDLVTSQLPRLFAVVQVYREHEDARVAAWGMAFDEGLSEVVSVEGHRRMRLASPDRALGSFSHAPDITARLVWPSDVGRS
ncbi:hypothetical protein [Streptomyces millisiae]|uniref:Uncharacterized protein n=1 Tax=Streptomyces millisiae TaxID=3075542 RepID=A0ABU2LT03_9ACTN|nr:hypothetical protein [Streptomyces sp. DSM 44918]MDT0320322.1 hypothetical protein [Streptomyces sp. DSM 44918]